MYLGSVVGQQRTTSADVDTDHSVVADRHGIRRDRLVRRQCQCVSGGEIELRAVPRAADAARVFVPLALAERAVVVRAAILDRIERAGAVVDADELSRP